MKTKKIVREYTPFTKVYPYITELHLVDVTALDTNYIKKFFPNLVVLYTTKECVVEGNKYFHHFFLKG